MAQSIGSIADQVRNGIDNIPSSVDSGTHLNNLITRSIRFVENYTGQSISTTAIPTKYQGLLEDFGKALVHSQMAGVGIDFNVRLGNFSVEKGSSSNVDVGRANYFLGMVNAELKLIGRGNKNLYSKVY